MCRIQSLRQGVLFRVRVWGVIIYTAGRVLGKWDLRIRA